MAKNQIATKDYSHDKAVVFNFADEQNVTVTADQFPADIQDRLLQYGIAQKLGDEYAGADGPEEARTLLTSLVERLSQGEWKQARSGGGGSRTTMLAEALSQVTGQDVEACQAKIAEMDDDAVKGLKAHKQVAAAMATIRAQRAAEAAQKATEAAVGDAEALQF
jgi:hypothetical protein